ncbi:hypothetical protein [Paenibacillus sp. FSL H3-0333]|uniref:hypothetical protein n=1 Tax=Paenibacillus sp. FSL H3-0333 TaxID=2921373 RepID=UPI0030FB4FE9
MNIRDNKEEIKVQATQIKPIRPTEIEFQSLDDLKKFVQYATSTEKTYTDILERVRKEQKAHIRTPRRK